MARRLTAAGMRPISNVVDVSNYVMLELNQPNHAYDLDTLGGGGFRIRLANDGEQLTTLDGEDRTFTSDDLFICDANDVPIGVGGIMGGLDTEISDDDHDGRARDGVVLARRDRPDRHPHQPALGGLGALRARRRPVRDAAGDRPVRRTAVRDVPEPRRARRSRRRPQRRICPPSTGRSRCASARSTASSAPTWPPTTCPALLDPIGYTVSGDGDTRDVVLPTWRLDSTEEVDVIEEVARHYGYDRLGKTVPKSVVHGELSVRQHRRRLVREVLLGLGYLRGDAESVPRPRHARQGGPAGRVGADHQPARRRGERAAHLAAPGPARGDRLQRVAPPHRAWRCSRSATSTRPPRASCPASTRR